MDAMFNRWRLVRPDAKLVDLSDSGALELLAQSKWRRTPVFAGPQGLMDLRLVNFAGSSFFDGIGPGSQKTYGYEIVTWLNFLHSQDPEMDWTLATEEHFRDFKAWRVMDPENPGLVAGSTFNKSVAGLTRLYDWAVKNGHTETSPIPAESKGGRAARVKAAKPSRDIWVTPSTYRLWRDVGIRGMTMTSEGKGSERRFVATGEFKGNFKGRNTGRKAAFADLIYRSGLRREEAGSLLLTEIPQGDTIRASLAAATTKFDKQGRSFLIPTDAKDRIATYVATERAAAVKRALKRGLYDQMDPIWITDTQFVKGRLRLLKEDGSSLAADHLDWAARTRLFRNSEQGPEPLLLWLGEAGLPLDPESWEKSFTSANRAIGREFKQLGFPGMQLNLTPHSLRFSFALAALVVLHQRIDEVRGPAKDGYHPARYHEAYDIVSNLLGHSSPAVTREIYVEPVRGLLGSALFSAETGSVDEILNQLSTIDGRVRSVGGGERS